MSSYPAALSVLGMDFAPAFPLWAAVAIGVAVCAWGAGMYLAPRYPERRAVRGVLLALRVGVLGLLAFCLLNPITYTLVPSQRRRVCVLLDDSVSMGIRDAEGGRSRWADATALTRQIGAALEKGGRYRPRTFTFGLDLSPVAGEVADRPTGSRTDIPSAVLNALASPGDASEADGRPAAVFVVTDGASNVPAQIESVSDRLRRARVPVFIALVGSAQPLTDVRIARIATSRKVALKTVVSLDVEVAAANVAEDVQTEVRLLHEGKVIEKQPVKLKNGTIRCAFTFTPGRKGMLSYTVKVEPITGEVMNENNREEVIVECDRRALNVLYMEGSQYRREGQALWEYQFLVQALEEDPDIRVTPLFKDDVAAAKKAGVFWIRHPTRGFPKMRGRLFGYDVIISSDIDIEYFTTDQLRNILDFVGQRGGGFVMIGGYTAFGAGGYDESIIDKILPVDMQGRDDGYFEDYDSQFKMKLTPEGLRHPICRIAADPVENFNIWETIPPLGGFNYVWKAKDLATVLAVHPTRMNNFGNYILLAVQQYGRGRTMAFTSDTTAGWGTKFETEWGKDAGNQYYRKFWQNAIRWLAAYRIDEAPRPILLSVDTNQYAPGDTVRVTARVFDENYNPSDEARINANVKTPGTGISTLTFASVSGNPGVYEATLKVRQDGHYTVRANALIGGRPLGEDAVTFVCNDRMVELKEYEPDTALLERIASASGGRLLRAKASSEAVAIAASLKVDRKSEGRRYHSVWTHWFVLTLICALLASEWWFRRKNGLP